MANALRIDRAAYNKIELGGRGVSLDEAATCAAFLDVPFVALITPWDSHGLFSDGVVPTVELAPGVEVDGDTVFLWASGIKPLSEEDERSFRAELDLIYGDVLFAPGVPLLRHLATLLGDAWAAGRPDHMEEIITRIERELDRQRDELESSRSKDGGILDLVFSLRGARQDGKPDQMQELIASIEGALDRQRDEIKSMRTKRRPRGPRK
jgi:transcriptional regulator with XRE-family HTH domain